MAAADQEACAKHTPGPWFVSPYDPLLVLAPDGDREPWEVCRAEDFCGETSDEVANARLIAAAPELLEACRALLGETAQWGKATDATLAAGYAAVAKAEGR